MKRRAKFIPPLRGASRNTVFHDDLGLEGVRQKISYYPRLIWFYQLSCQWKKIAEDEEFVGRCGDMGDELGSIV
ncbi:MAG: DUF4037 domain-containing protein [Pyrinomonadaceae bacterium]